jgi:nicotinate-nucleotide adenylyltransferase
VQIAVYGGSFNPPHRAHAMVAEWVLSSRVADAVWLVPVFRHAFEGIHGKTLAPYGQRVGWCQALAAEVGPRVAVSQVEALLPSPSYTIDTLTHLSSEHPEHQFRLVVGADILDQVDSWKGWDRIAAQHTPIVVGREGYPSPPGVPLFPAVSSTAVRERLAAGESAEALLTPAVWALLRGHQPWGQ